MVQERTLITYISRGPRSKPSSRKKKKGPGLLVKTWKFVLLSLLIGVYLVYTNQSSTLGYSLRNSLSELEIAQDMLDDVLLTTSKKEQQLWVDLERTPTRDQITKLFVD